MSKKKIPAPAVVWTSASKKLRIVRVYSENGHENKLEKANGSDALGQPVYQPSGPIGYKQEIVDALADAYAKAE